MLRASESESTNIDNNLRHVGEHQVHMVGVSPWVLILEDRRAQYEGFLSPGFWALLIYRLGRAALGIEWAVIRLPMRAIHLVFYKICEFFLGIVLPVHAVIGRRLVIEHSGGIVVHGCATIGDDCTIRHGVTIGTRYTHRAREAPHIGSRVDIGCGAKIIGAVTVGDDAAIGANAVVLDDVPAGYIAVAPKAAIRARTPRKAATAT